VREGNPVSASNLMLAAQISPVPLTGETDPAHGERVMKHGAVGMSGSPSSQSMPRQLQRCTGEGNLSNDWNGRLSARTDATSCQTTAGRLRGFPMLE